MTILSKDVYSSHVSTVSYDIETKELEVVWDSGRISVYADVPKEVAEKAMTSWSVGSFLASHVKGVYQHGYKK